MKRLLTDIDCCCCFIAFFSVIQAIPVKDNSGGESPTDNRAALENVCVHENAVYKAGQNFSTGNPCETCVCDPPGVSCSLRSCDLKGGCKAIHRANRCCPEYVCECESNGKIYGNGEKVEEPNPCKVCYCKGGEIKCALVTCYTRDDCEPGYVAGVCCPKYDHCPPLDEKNNSTSLAPAPVLVSDLKTGPTVAFENANITPGYLTSLASYASTEATTVEDTTVTEMTTFFDSTTEVNEATDADLNTTTEMSTEFSTQETTDSVTTEEVNDTTEPVTTEEITTEESTTLMTTTDEMKVYILQENSTTAPTESTSEYITALTEESAIIETDTTTEGFTSREGSTTEVPDTELPTTNSSSPKPERRSTSKPMTSSKSVIKVIIPKTMKKNLEQVQKSLDGPAPIVVMISAEQIQFLKLAEEPPMYVENRDADEQKTDQDHLGVVVVPKTTPTTVEMVKVVEATPSNTTMEAAKPVYTLNSTDLIQDR